MDVPPPPWSLRGEGLVAFPLPRPAPGAPPGRPVAGIVAARYAASPVGGYCELAVGVPARRGGHLGVAVTAMVVDSARSVDGGRGHWGFPKELGRLAWVDGGGVEWEEACVRVAAGSPRGPRVVLLVPFRALQERDGQSVVVPARLRARARFAPVTVDAAPGSAFWELRGRHPGVVLFDLRLQVRAARPVR